ncbi:SMP-30/gluconolactonase/LRE family protein [Alicyclobacillus fastidiosus]|uniref:SMP-30/gluconolactonase/LRE family protein n=1 Tax=Alicyclobacillus fastidiosus TaxID=392011 RepID=UPI002DD42889|nr:SMP-30/gluconolactonase/LRE family protein [Alicyclobacillus fastidiosus]
MRRLWAGNDGHQLYAWCWGTVLHRFTNGRVVVTINEGYPDGMCVDAEGMIWVAHWGGSKVTRGEITK